jgi:hypothetical protein
MKSTPIYGNPVGGLAIFGFIYSFLCRNPTRFVCSGGGGGGGGGRVHSSTSAVLFVVAYLDVSVGRSWRLPDSPTSSGIGYWLLDLWYSDGQVGMNRHKTEWVVYKWNLTGVQGKLKLKPTRTSFIVRFLF